MSESRAPDSQRNKRSFLKPSLTILSLLCPITAISVAIVFHYEPLDPAPLPAGELSDESIGAPRVNDRMLRGAERVGVGRVVGPEDVAYDPESKVVYVGCADGWIKRVNASDAGVDPAAAVVEDWVNTGGRPLGLAVAGDGAVVVGDPDKGLLRVSKEGTVELLTDEAEGLKFKLTDGVDVARDGTIYFTDASYKYTFKEFIWDVLEGRPHGRFLSYDPTTKVTKVLARGLFFANGVAVSPDQNYVIFCETIMSRCKRYYINGEQTGHIDTFIDRLPGFPDNIKYDGEGHYWIGLSTGRTIHWDLALKYPFIRKAAAILERYGQRLAMEKNSGVFQIDLEGRPVAHYYDPQLALITSGNKIGDYLYCGSLYYPYIIRLKLN